MQRTLLVSPLAILIWLALAPSVFAAEALRAASIFEKPSYASRQVEILPAKAQVQVTGRAESHDDIHWVPVQTSRGTGWVTKDSLELSERPGYESWRSDAAPWLWASAGPSFMNSYDFFVGTRVAAGVDWFVNDRQRFFLGPYVSTEFSKEKLNAQFNGKSQRYNTYFSVGYLLLPDRVYTRFGLGLSVLAGANRNLAHKFGASGSAELGFLVPLSEATKLGLSFSFEYTGKSRQSVNFFQDLYHCALGGCDPSQPIPSATIFALNATFWFGP